MLLLVFGAVIFACLCVGAVVFLACVAAPPTRKYALSAALWCAVWGPCAVGWMVVAGVALVTGAIVSSGRNEAFAGFPKLLEAVGWTYLGLGIAGTAAVATGVAWLHQALVRRSTLALFRLYAAVVCGGIGSVFGWLLGWWMLADWAPRFGLLLWLPAMLVLMVGFGLVAYKHARKLRGAAPTKLTWITGEEYLGIESPQKVGCGSKTKRFWQ
jgi:hypothetical protein